jgi:DNA-damage-inducible protein J
MAKSATIRARTEPDVKEKAEAVIRELGLNPSTVITMLYRAIIRRRALPFEPNATTLGAMHDAEHGTNLIEAESIDGLITLLDEPDEEPVNGAQARRNQAVQDRQTASGKARVEHRSS